MASNYWLSSQCEHWQLSKSHLAKARAEDLRYANSADEVGAVGIWCSNVISALTKRLNLRQRVTATACVFFRRFYSRIGNSYCSTDPALVCTACIYVASKAEETPVHVRSVAAEGARIWTELGHRSYPADVSSLAEMEFYLLEELDFHLIVHHPYRSLLAISGSVGKTALAKAAASSGNASRDPNSSDAGLGLGLTLPGGSGSAADIIDVDLAEEAAKAAAEEEMLAQRDRLALSKGEDGAPVARLEELDDAALQMAWFVLNDTYRTDIPLLYPPHLIAVAAVYLALALHIPSRDSMEASVKRMEERRAKWSKACEDYDVRMAQANGASSKRGKGLGETNGTSGSEDASKRPRLGGVSTPGATASSSTALPSRTWSGPGASPGQPTSVASPSNPTPPGLPAAGAKGWASLPMRPAHLPQRPGAAVTGAAAAAPSNGNVGGGTGGGGGSSMPPTPAGFNAPGSGRFSSSVDSPVGGGFSTPPGTPGPQDGGGGGGGTGLGPGGAGTVPDVAPVPPRPPAPPPDALTFLAALNVDLSMVAEIVQEMVSSYELWHRVSATRPAAAAAPGLASLMGSAAGTGGNSPAAGSNAPTPASAGGGGGGGGGQAEEGSSSSSALPGSSGPSGTPGGNNATTVAAASTSQSLQAQQQQSQPGMISDGSGMFRRLEEMRERRRVELRKLEELAAKGIY